MTGMEAAAAVHHEAMIRGRFALMSVALLAAGCQRPCVDGSSVAILLRGANLSSYLATLSVATRRLILVCPGAGTMDGWPVSCNRDRILVTPMGADVRGIDSVSLGLTSLGGRVLLPDQLVQLGGPLRDPPDSDQCLREGVVVQPISGADAILKVVPTGNDFGTVSVGTTSAPFGFELSNIGQDVSGTPELTVTGDFTISSPPCSALRSLDKCLVLVTFHPGATGVHTGALTFKAAYGGTVQAVPSGTGLLRDGGTD
jgi:hypothetical protein